MKKQPQTFTYLLVISEGFVSCSGNPIGLNATKDNIKSISSSKMTPENI